MNRVLSIDLIWHPRDCHQLTLKKIQHFKVDEKCDFIKMILESLS